MDLTGRVALVTGGAGHIGMVICEALAELGAMVAVLDLDESRCSSTADWLRERYQSVAFPVAADLADHARIRPVAEDVITRAGRLDILVNCAALVGTSDLRGWTSPFEEQGYEAWCAALNINLTAAFLLCQACAPALSSSGAGAIVNINSIYGTFGPDMRLYEGTAMGNPAAYAASKGGLLQLTRWLATVLAPRVRVNSITCGGVRRQQPEPFVMRYIDRTPLARMATEEDFKGAAAYLASDLSRYVTGQDVHVDGGWGVW
jgi:NAD(P)-dependent dehydrogenase (short-subunit alcohol dehydrogenase family)